MTCSLLFTVLITHSFSVNCFLNHAWQQTTRQRHDVPWWGLSLSAAETVATTRSGEGRSGRDNDQGSAVAHGGVEGDNRLTHERLTTAAAERRRQRNAKSGWTSRAITSDENGTDRHGAAAGLTARSNKKPVRDTEPYTAADSPCAQVRTDRIMVADDH